MPRQSTRERRTTVKVQESVPVSEIDQFTKSLNPTENVSKRKRGGTESNRRDNQSQVSKESSTQRGKQNKSVKFTDSAPPKQQRVFVEDPLAKRYRTCEKHLKDFRCCIDKIRRLDIYEVTLGEGFNAAAPTHPRVFNFSKIYDAFHDNKYTPPAIDIDEWRKSRFAFLILKGKIPNEENLNALSSRFDREDFKKILWDEFEADIEKLVQSVFKYEKRTEDDPSSAWAAAVKISQEYKEIIAAYKTKHEADLKALLEEERMKDMGVQNREPAMPHWRKKPYEPREYFNIDKYVPVHGIPLEESCDIETMLVASGPNRWLENDFFKHVDEAKRSKSKINKPPQDDDPSWMVKQQDIDCKCAHTWGIDAYTRRNVLLVLETVEPAEMRMNQPQIQWFIEGILLRAVNSIQADVAYDIRHALEKIKFLVNQDVPSEELTSAMERECPLYQPAIDDKLKEEALENVENVEPVMDGSQPVKQEPCENPADVPENDATILTAPVETADEKSTPLSPDAGKVATTETIDTQVVSADSTQSKSQDANHKNPSTGEESASKDMDIEESAPEVDRNLQTNVVVSVGVDDKMEVDSEEAPLKDPAAAEADDPPEIAVEKEPLKKSKTNNGPGRRLKNIWNQLATDLNPEHSAADGMTSRRKRKQTELYEAVPKVPKISKVQLAEPEPIVPSVPAAKPKPRSKTKKAAGHQVDNSPVAQQERQLVGSRISLFWSLDHQWFGGRVIAYDDTPEPGKKEPGQNLLIHYDDAFEEWIDIRKERYIMEDGRVTIYDRNISKEVLLVAIHSLMHAVESWTEQSFCVHPKGSGILCRTHIGAGDLVGPYYGEIYPLWLWEQKEAREDRARRAVVDGKVTLPDFWNMRLELPADTPGGFNMMYVDAKYHGTLASRFSHSCRPNCGATLAVFNGKYAICVRAIRDIDPGEEITIDYNCVTDSIEEFREAICLCGYEGCRGSFLYFSGASQYMQVVDRRHRIAHRVAMLFEAGFEIRHAGRAIPLNEYDGSLEPCDKKRLEKFGLKSYALEHLPVWLLRYCALALKFVELEELELTARLFVEEMSRRKAAVEGNIEEAWMKPKKGDVLEEQIVADLWESMKRESRAVAQQRASNLVVAINKVKHRMDARIRLGAEETDFVEPSANSSNHTNSRLQSLSDHQAQLRHLIAESNAKLVERVWWVGDRAEAKWCGDDAAEFPDWYPGTILHVYHEGLKRVSAGSVSRINVETGPSVHFQYDTGELDRIPLDPIYLRRAFIPPGVRTTNMCAIENGEEAPEATGEIVTTTPPSTQDVFPEPFIGMSAFHHQSPLRALNDSEIVDALWNDPINSVAQRLVRMLREVCPTKHSLWQSTNDPYLFKPYWWSLETKEIRKSKPSVEDAQKTIEIIPEALAKIEDLVKYVVNTPKEARDGLEQIRSWLLCLPTPSNCEYLEDIYQKSIDLLTFYCHTKHWFLVKEAPPIPKSINPWRASLLRKYRQQAACYNTRNNFDELSGGTSSDSTTHESSVVAPLLGWLDQKEEGLEISNLLGSVVLPNIESAFVRQNSGAYKSNYRSVLMRQLLERQRRYEEWNSDVRECFPDVPPKIPTSSITAWPPPVPPLQLCGSPVLDASISDNREFEKLTSRLSGDLNDVYAKKALQDLEKPASTRGNLIFEQLTTDLKACQRDSSKWTKEEAKRWQPPPPPVAVQYTWVQCSRKECNKWRKLPLGYAATDFPDPFYCEHLQETDPDFANCSIGEESSTGETTMRWGYGISGVDDLAKGHRVDAYVEKRWIAAEVIDARPDAVLVQFPKTSELKDRWIPRHPPGGKFPQLSPLYSWTNKSDDEYQSHKMVQIYKQQKSPYGPKVSPKDYECHFAKIGVTMQVSMVVRSVMAYLVNEVSARCGEPLGKITVAAQKRVLLNHQPRQTYQQTSASIAESKANFAFLEDMKRLHCSKMAFQDLYAHMEQLSTEQHALWNSSHWSFSRYHDWFKDIKDPQECNRTTDEDEEEVFQGMHVRTPQGEGVVLRRTGPRRYAIAVRGKPGDVVSTAYGDGELFEVDDMGKGIVKLRWGAWLFQFDIAVVYEFFIAIPVYPWLQLRATNTSFTEYEKQRRDRTSGATSHAGESVSTKDDCGEMAEEASIKAEPDMDIDE